MVIKKKRKTTARKTRVVYVREEDSLDRTARTVGNLAVLGLGIGMVGGVLGAMNK